MKVNGYRLREALRRHQLIRETAAAQFTPSLIVFPGEKKQSPFDIAGAVERAELAIAAIQTAQSQYNASVPLLIGGEARSLTYAIKRLGALQRVEKLWRVAATGKKDKYAHYRSDSPDRKKADEVIAERAVSPEEAMMAAEIVAKELGALREAIATANARELDIDLDASLLE